MTTPGPHASRPADARVGYTVLERMVTHTGPVFRVESLRVADSRGRIARRDVVRHPGAVTVLAQLADGRYVMIRNQRIAVGETLLEFCAGKLEPGEPPAITAGRELEEECGYRAGSIVPLGTFYTSPGFADERMYVFLATDLEPIDRRLEPGEEIDVVILRRDEIEAAIRAGTLVDGKSLAAWMLHVART
ncbi:MAG: NUDIX hydrolase [Phycisphaerae bacterium]|nr:NUDIX hydrolase [Phycisphaerae bacterium]